MKPIFIFSLPVIIKRIDLSVIKSKVIRDVIIFGLPFLPAGIFTMVMELSNRYILEWLEGTYAVGLFSAGYKLGIFGLIIVMGFNMGWTPYFLKRIKEEGAKKEFSHIASLFLGLLGFIVIMISIWIPEIMRLKIGSNYLIGDSFWSAEKVVSIVLIGYFFFGTYVIQLPGVYAKEITTWNPIFRAIGAISNITLNIILIPKYGVLGSAWATAISFVFMSLSVFIKLFNIYYVKYNWKAVFYPILFMAIIFSPLQSVLLRVFAGCFYWAGWYFLAISKDERRQLRSLGIKIGRYHIFLPKMLKPKAVELRILLWEFFNGSNHKNLVPKSGLNFLFDKTGSFNQRFLLLCGFERFKNFYIRVDLSLIHI